MENTDNSWRKCTICKKPIAFGARYYTCSVSTCNGQRTGYAFCSVPCFDAHIPGAKHRDAAAMEEKAPLRQPNRTIIAPAKPAGIAAAPSKTSTAMPRETLIIASRLKEYIQARSEMNTSAQVMDVLSDYVRVVSDRAIDNARADGRKTVLDRDFSFLKK
jgi:histone H3/H4